MRRRSRMAAMVAAATFLGACKAPPVSTSAPDPRGGLDAREAPMLHDLVAAGKLPPVAERLPSDPLVVTPAGEDGLYGGAWRMMVTSPDMAMFRVIGNYAPLIRWRPDSRGVAPSLAASWEMSADGRALTLHLRHGIRWSDGAPFTSADIAYWWDVVRDGRSRLVAPFWAMQNGTPMKVEAPDPYTVVMRFAAPNWYAPLHLANGIDYCDQYDMPKHYLQAFDPRLHPEYADFSTFDRKNRMSENPDRPTLGAWRLARREDGGLRDVFERNPYYWMTDDRGRQLPYIDRVVAKVVDDSELRVLSILAGDVDAQFRWQAEINDLPLYLEGQKHGHYHVRWWAEGTGARNAIFTNWSAKDPVKRALFRDKRFRRALSLGIDRTKISEVSFRGLAKPQQATISPQSWHFETPEGKAVYQQWSHAWSDFDPVRANALLDEIGLTKRDAEGFRLRPDGKRLQLVFDMASGVSGAPEDEAEIAAEGWRKLGIQTIVHAWPLAMWSLRQGQGDFDVSNSVEAEMDVFTYPDWIFPATESEWHGPVGRWYRTGGKEGEAPTGPLKDLLDLYTKIQSEPDEAKAHRMVLDAIRIHIDEGPFTIGTVGDLPSMVIVRDNFRNVPEAGPDDPRVLAAWAVAQPAASFPETFYFAPESAPAEAAK